MKCSWSVFGHPKTLLATTVDIDFTKGFGDESPQKIKCMHNTFWLCMHRYRKGFVCTKSLGDSSVCTKSLLAIFKTLKMAKNHRFWRKWHFYDFCVFLLCPNFIFKVHFFIKNVDLKNYFCIYLMLIFFKSECLKFLFLSF